MNIYAGAYIEVKTIPIEEPGATVECPQGHTRYHIEELPYCPRCGSGEYTERLIKRIPTLDDLMGVALFEWEDIMVGLQSRYGLLLISNQFEGDGWWATWDENSHLRENVVETAFPTPEQIAGMIADLAQYAENAGILRVLRESPHVKSFEVKAGIIPWVVD